MEMFRKHEYDITLGRVGHGEGSRVFLFCLRGQNKFLQFVLRTSLFFPGYYATNPLRSSFYREKSLVLFSKWFLRL